MKDYNYKVYLSASWRDGDSQLSKYISKLLDQNGLLIVGDDPYYKNHSHERGLDYSARVSEILSSCSGFVAVLPKRDNEQTTSPFMFIELLLADKFKLPIIIFSEEKIKLQIKYNGSEKAILHFGNSKSTPVTLTDLEKNKFTDYFIDSVSSIKMEHYSSLSYLCELPANKDRLNTYQDKIKSYISNFTSKLITPYKDLFVFNITPFSMMKHHREVAKTILKETGLPCYIAKDDISSDLGIRQKGTEFIKKSLFIISDISKLNPTCIYETGVAYGQSKNIFVLKNGKKRKLPFGLDDLQVHYYKNLKELNKKATEICKGYKVRVINFELSTNDVLLGIPDWYYDKNKFVVSKKLLLMSGLAGVLLCLFLNYLLGTSILNFFLGVGIPLISTMITISSKIQNYLETLLIDNMKTIITVMISLIILLVLLSVIR